MAVSGVQETPIERHESHLISLVSYNFSCVVSFCKCIDEPVERKLGNPAFSWAALLFGRFDLAIALMKMMMILTTVMVRIQRILKTIAMKTTMITINIVSKISEKGKSAHDI